MTQRHRALLAALATAFGLAGTAVFAETGSGEICTGFGPQSPRDIASGAGLNERITSIAPESSMMNLCDIHLHVNAEHKAPGFSTFAGDGIYGGFQCNETTELTEAELTAPGDGTGASFGVRPGDTVEVHWVYTSCAVEPGPTLGSCFTEACPNPQLRVETQVYLAVNDPGQVDFLDYTLNPEPIDGYYQSKTVPFGTGDPVTYTGSTTGPSFSQATCSPFQVTWSVRPQCAKLNVASLYEWFAGGNAFDEHHAHGVRALVVSQELLSAFD